MKRCIFLLEIFLCTNYSGKLVICGGGINECFKEVEIALNALNKNYNVLIDNIKYFLKHNPTMKKQ